MEPVSPNENDGGNSERVIARGVLLGVEDDRPAALEPLLAIDARKDELSIRLGGMMEGGEIVVAVRERLASLDVFRGLAIAIMILVDDGGGKWPSINHSPWNGVTLADFVMPAFLFIVGLAIPLAFKKVQSKRQATSKALSRALKLWLVGVMLQGGSFHGINDLTYGVDVRVIRWGGILQRIVLVYILVALCEIWNPRISSLSAPDGPYGLLKMYFWHWAVAGLLSTVYLVLLYGLFVPDWEFKDPNTGSVLTVKCGVRGDLTPPCNAVGYVDRVILGINHLYKNPVYKRTEACSINSPDYGPPPAGAPAWCLAPFEPEGLLSSVSAVGSCFIGLHYGHVLLHIKNHASRVKNWAGPAVGFIIIGVTLHYLGMPLNKPLYSLSYVLLTAGVAGLSFVAIYLLVDVKAIRWPTAPLEWMGMNSLLLYVLAASEVGAAFLQGLYWKTPDNNLVDFTEQHVFGAIISSAKWAKLVFVLFEILFWALVAGACHANNAYWKL